MKIILGSASTRRREILSYFYLPYEQAASHFEEETIPFTGDPAAYAQEIAKQKALALSKLYENEVILTADTVVSLGDKVFGKPRDEEEAFSFISQLQGKTHSVFTAVAVYHQGVLHEGVEQTRVFFNAMTPEQIRAYLKALHFADKAGGYAIQLAGSLIVNRIEGCYYNVIGLPINTVAKLLKKVGIDLWKCLN
ncbi:MAG: Maf family nucleotide pyrophosphatase [Parachlamydiaceae bacterium]